MPYGKGLVVVRGMRASLGRSVFVSPVKGLGFPVCLVNQLETLYRDLGQVSMPILRSRYLCLYVILSTYSNLLQNGVNHGSRSGIETG